MYFPSKVLTFLVIVLIVYPLRRLMKLDTNNELQKIEKTIEQPLDHFTPSDKRTFRMRYWQTLDFWKPGGPIIIYVGGEQDMSPSNKTTSDQKMNVLYYLIANDTDGLLLETEHRYYGKSVPTISRDNLTEFYQFLSSRQALADIAYLIKTFKSDPKYDSSKVVVVGGSYAGNLAVWLRELYPDLVDAAVAASAPVLAKKDFKEHQEVVSSTFSKYGGEECLNSITALFQRFEKLLKSPEGIETLKRELNICRSSDLTVLENQQLLFLTAYGEFNGVAQDGSPYSVKNKCESILKHSFMLDSEGCVPSIECGCMRLDFDLLISKWEKPNSVHGWYYQQCTEFGYFRTTAAEVQPFVHWVPLNFIINLFCKNLIKGEKEMKIDEAVARTNRMYGGKRPNVTKVVFTHGDVDPWHPLGVLEDLGPDAPAIMINGTSHCAIFTVNKDEPIELTRARTYVRKLIKKWISTP